MRAGDTALTRMLKGARSLAEDTVRPRIAHFDATYLEELQAEDGEEGKREEMV
jgi:hypothetical protein